MSDQAATHQSTPSNQSRKTHRRVSITDGIGRTLLLSFLALTLLPLVLVGTISGLQSRVSIAETTQARLNTVADLREQTVRNWLKEREQDLQSLRNDTLTVNWMQSVLVSSENLVSSDRLYTQSLPHCALSARSGPGRRIHAPLFAGQERHRYCQH